LYRHIFVSLRNSKGAVADSAAAGDAEGLKVSGSVFLGDKTADSIDVVPMLFRLLKASSVPTNIVTIAPATAIIRINTLVVEFVLLAI